MSEAISEWFEDMFDYNIYENGVLVKTWKEDLLQKNPLSDLIWSTIMMLICFVGMMTWLVRRYWTSLQRVYASIRESIKSGSVKIGYMRMAVQTHLDPVWPWLRPLTDFLGRVIYALLEHIRRKVVTLLGGQIHGALPETTSVDTSAQESALREELTDANAANTLLRDELTAANAANASLRDELAAASKPVEDVPQLPPYAPRLSLGRCKAKSLFQRAPRYPGLCVPTPLSQVRETAEEASNSMQPMAVTPAHPHFTKSTRIVEVKAAYAHAVTNTSPETPAERHTTSSFSPLKTVSTLR